MPAPLKKESHTRFHRRGATCAQNILRKKKCFVKQFSWTDQIFRQKDDLFWLRCPGIAFPLISSCLPHHAVLQNMGNGLFLYYRYRRKINQVIVKGSDGMNEPVCMEGHGSLRKLFCPD